MCTQTSGTSPPSSHASSELSTASLTVVRSALRGLSKPVNGGFGKEFADRNIPLSLRHRLGGRATPLFLDAPVCRLGRSPHFGRGRLLCFDGRQQQYSFCRGKTLNRDRRALGDNETGLPAKGGRRGESHPSLMMGQIITTHPGSSQPSCERCKRASPTNLQIMSHLPRPESPR